MIKAITLFVRNSMDISTSLGKNNYYYSICIVDFFSENQMLTKPVLEKQFKHLTL